MSEPSESATRFKLVIRVRCIIQKNLPRRRNLWVTDIQSALKGQPGQTAGPTETTQLRLLLYVASGRSN
jgi:hypothetical protein